MVDDAAVAAAGWLMMDREGRKAPTPVREAIRAMDSFILQVNGIGGLG